eukprot:GDKJ01057491.1.p1 GENE.GDKJ01057491.1~~GDKJ01057491.1.p1  ORF type:complete len:170 (+),score=31.18 GDKJ01057491.1:25-534(+)
MMNTGYVKRPDPPSSSIDNNTMATLMYAYGDSNTPMLESLSIVELLTKRFMVSILKKANAIAHSGVAGNVQPPTINEKHRHAIRVKPEHLLDALDEHPKKRRRALEVLRINDKMSSLLHPWDLSNDPTEGGEYGEASDRDGEEDDDEVEGEEEEGEERDDENESASGNA